MARLFPLGLFLFACLPLAADDWSQFLGEHRDGHSGETGILQTWPETGPPELWRAEVGPGYGGAAIAGGAVFLFDREDDARNVLRCFDLASGEERWRLVHDAPGRVSFNGSRTVPAVAAERVFATDPFGHAICADRATGALVWEVDLIEDFAGEPPRFAYASSPLLVGDAVILTALGPEVGLAAFGQESGELLWKTESVGGESYCSPALLTVAGRELVVFVGRGGLYGFDPASGETVLHTEAYAPGAPIPAPTAIDGDRFLVTSGYNGGTKLLHIEAADEGFAVSELFAIEKDGAQLHQPLFVDGFFYANFNRDENIKDPAGLVCLDLEGNVRWQTRATPGIERGNVITVDGHLLMLGGEDGVLRLVRPDPEGYVEVARASVFEGLKAKDNQIWAPMALSDRKLVLRSGTTLKCLDLAQP